MFMRFARVACCFVIILMVAGCASLAEERGWIAPVRERIVSAATVAEPDVQVAIGAKLERSDRLQIDLSADQRIGGPGPGQHQREPGESEHGDE